MMNAFIFSWSSTATSDNELAAAFISCIAANCSSVELAIYSE